MSALVDPSSDRAAREWMRRLARRLAMVRQLGLPDRQDAEELPLARLYVPLVVTRGGGAAARLNPVDVVRQSPRVVLLGEPGSGKTSFVSWLALGMASRWQEAAPAEMAWWLPYPVFLREIAWEGVRGWTDLLGRITTRQGGEPPEGLDVEEWISRGQLLLLLDGLDEVPVSSRVALTAALREGVRRHPGLRFVVTSRVLGYERSPVDRAVVPSDDYGRGDPLQMPPGWEGGPSMDVDLVHAAPFDAAQVRAFVTAWYRLRVADPLRREEGTRGLVAALEASPTLRDLASRPSLLALMAMVHRVYATLPQGRVTLFERTIEAYLESIDRAAGVGDPTGLSLPQKRRLLGVLATAMNEKRAEQGGGWRPRGRPENAGVVVTREGAIAAIKGEVGSEPAAETFIEHALERSGLIIPQVSGEIAFLHLALQDYLAAVVLVEDLGRGFVDIGAARRAWERLLTWFESPACAEAAAMVLEILGAQPTVLSATIMRLKEDAGPARSPRRYGLAEVLHRTSAPIDRSGLRDFFDDVAISAVEDDYLLAMWAADFGPWLRRRNDVKELKILWAPSEVDWGKLDGLAELQELWLPAGCSVKLSDFPRTLARLKTLEVFGQLADPDSLAQAGRLRRISGVPIRYLPPDGVEDVTVFGWVGDGLAELSHLSKLRTLRIRGGFRLDQKRLRLPAGVTRLEVDLHGEAVPPDWLTSTAISHLVVRSYGAKKPIRLFQGLPHSLKTMEVDLFALASDAHDAPVMDLTPLADHPGLTSVRWLGPAPIVPEKRRWKFSASR